MSRYTALGLLLKAFKDKQHLNKLLKRVDHPNRNFIAELCYGVCRHYDLLTAILNRLLDKPLKSKAFDIQMLMLIGLYQLKFTDVPSYAAVKETVNVAVKQKKSWARGMLNAVFRRYLREKDTIDDWILTLPVETRYSYPLWLVDALQESYPQDVETILDEGNQRASIYLRVNEKQTSTDDYFIALQKETIAATRCSFSPTAIQLDEALDVTTLPYFDKGYVSVQDLSAQMAAPLLSVTDNMDILDACAAPGGKTAHLLELANQSNNVYALDISEERVKRISENLSRLSLQAHIAVGDATKPDTWSDGRLYDRILLDAPCSATGVIRRHPDIKWFRTEEDVDHISKTQRALLTALWPLVKPKGQLLYITCSILARENERQAEWFLDNHRDAVVKTFQLPIGKAASIGWQILPKISDGFYYALFEKVC